MSWANFSLLLFGLGWALTGIYRTYAIDKGIVDRPTARSSHAVVTPRGGGLAIAILFTGLLGVCHYLNWIETRVFYIFLPGAIVAFIGFRDDVKSLSAKTRLLAQTVAACLSLYHIGFIDISSILGFSLPVYVIWGILLLSILWMTNLMNFMDGTDGLAGTQVIFLFANYGFFLTASKGFSLTVLAFGMVAIVSGFLAWNWPKASIFMGDVGSGFLGFVSALLAMVSYKWFAVPLELFLILTAAFWFDATVTLARRFLARENVTEAHSLHAYQRLVHAGWSHLSVLLGLISVNTVLTLMALGAYKHPEYTKLFLASSICFVTLVYLLIESYKPMYRTWHARR